MTDLAAIDVRSFEPYYQQLKRILVKDHRREFYRCLSEKLLTYSLGRGLGYSDVGAVDQLVERIEKENGRATALIVGVIESAPFQRRQRGNARKSPNAVESQSVKLGSRP